MVERALKGAFKELKETLFSAIRSKGKRKIRVLMRKGRADSA